eukprot:SAG31_NODE_1034_length_10228_cov_89.107316_15_plen_170_part_00
MKKPATLKHGDTFSISALHLAIKVPYFSNSGHKNEKVTALTCNHCGALVLEDVDANRPQDCCWLFFTRPVVWGARRMPIKRAGALQLRHDAQPELRRSRCGQQRGSLRFANRIRPGLATRRGAARSRSPLWPGGSQRSLPSFHLSNLLTSNTCSIINLVIQPGLLLQLY